MRTGPEQRQSAPGRGAGVDGRGAQGELVRQDERGPGIAARELLLAAEPDETAQSYGVGHRDRCGQRHPGPGSRELARHPGEHGQVQCGVVRRQQVQHGHGRAGLVHHVGDGAVQQLRARTRGGDGGGMVLHAFQRPPGRAAAHPLTDTTRPVREYAGEPDAGTEAGAARTRARMLGSIRALVEASRVVTGAEPPVPRAGCHGRCSPAVPWRRAGSPPPGPPGARSRSAGAADRRGRRTPTRRAAPSLRRSS